MPYIILGRWKDSAVVVPNSVLVADEGVEKGHLNFVKRSCAPQTHREPFGDAGRHAKPSRVTQEAFWHLRRRQIRAEGKQNLPFHEPSFICATRWT